MHSYAAKAIRWILIATVVGTLPALVFLGFGIVDYRKPPNYAMDPDPELSVTIPLVLVIVSAVVTSAAASLVAVVYYLFVRQRYEKDKG